MTDDTPIDPISIRWPAASPVDPASPPCPTCGMAGVARPLLDATARFGQQPRETRVLSCTACGCAYMADPLDHDYAEEAAPPAPVLAFHTQHSAGIEQIVQTLARVRRPANTRLLDIGCGFGFGLDFAITARGWKGQGIDPGGLAQAGRVALGVPIQHRMLEARDGLGAADVVMASEVLEHLASPTGFVAMLRAALAPGGVLVISTPDADGLRPESPDSVLIPVLSLGSHAVLQNAASIEALLRQAGFAEVSVRANGMSLIAYASDAPLSLVEDATALDAEYAAYLDRRQVLSRPGTSQKDFAARQQDFVRFLNGFTSLKSGT